LKKGTRPFREKKEEHRCRGGKSEERSVQAIGPKVFYQQEPIILRTLNKEAPTISLRRESRPGRTGVPSTKNGDLEHKNTARVHAARSGALSTTRTKTDNLGTKSKL